MTVFIAIQYRGSACHRRRLLGRLADATHSGVLGASRAARPLDAVRTAQHKVDTPFGGGLPRGSLAQSLTEGHDCAGSPSGRRTPYEFMVTDNARIVGFG